jgi:hypothetical protein
VLPLDTLSDEPADRHFANAVTADLIHSLTRFRELSVIARESAFHFRDRGERRRPHDRPLPRRALPVRRLDPAAGAPPASALRAGRGRGRPLPVVRPDRGDARRGLRRPGRDHGHDRGAAGDPRHGRPSARASGRARCPSCRSTGWCCVARS